MKTYSLPVNGQNLKRTIKALENNGFNVLVASSEDEAKEIALEVLPPGSEVMEHTSKTLNEIGLSDEIDNSGKFASLHKKAVTMDREKQGKEISQMRSVHDWSVGSFHAVTEDGKIMLASGSGSQIPGYAYGAKNVLFIAGTQKIVKNLDEGFDRIYNHSLPLESERMNKTYNTTVGSNVRRILILNSESNTARTTIIFIKKSIGF